MPGDFVEITIERRLFSNGEHVPGMTSPHHEFAPVGQSYPLMEVTTVPDPNDPDTGYDRQFWTYKNNEFIYDSPATIPGAQVDPPPFTATCWYTSHTKGKTPKGVHSAAFSLTSNRFIEECPVENSSRPGFWCFNPFELSQAQVTAKASINGEAFQYWLVLGEGIYNDRVLTRQDEDKVVFAVAFYKDCPLAIDEGFDEVINWIWTIIPPSVARKLIGLLATGTAEQRQLKLYEASETELDAMARNPVSTDYAKLERGLADISDKIGRLDILKKNISDALSKLK